MVGKIPLTLQIGCDVFISLIPEDIIKINIPQGQTLQTSFIELCLWVKVIIPVVRGNANWDW